MKKLRFILSLTLAVWGLSLAAPQAPGDLAGEWMFGALSFTNYRDAYTLKLSDDGGGIGDKIKISADGTYERAARMKFTLYTCTTRLAIWERGTIEVSGGRIAFRPKEGAIRSEDSCNAKNNYQKPVSPWSRGWEIGRDGYGRTTLMLKSENGDVLTYLRQLRAGL